MTLLPHPLAELFPLMAGADFDALVEDIKANGQHQPVVLLEGKILDGRNRYRACELIGVEAKTQEFNEPCSPQSYVASMNLHRRHLNESQRAMIATRMANLPANRPTNKSADMPTSISQGEAAKLLNVGVRTVRAAKTVLEKGTPEEIAGVQAGTLGVTPIANAIHKKAPPKQRAQERAIPSHKKGNNPASYDKQRFEAAIWGRLRDGLTNIAGLPTASDVVKISRKMDKSNLINRTLATAIAWLTEFEDALTRAE